MPPMTPYSNEADSLAIGGMTIENNPDRVAVYGSLQITKDTAGLQQAKELKTIIDAVVAALEAEKTLPDQVSTRPSEQVDNPFK